MTGLTTHVLDAVHGGGAPGVRVQLSVRDGERFRVIKTVRTRDNGRAELLDRHELAPGEYELLFGVADYFRERGVALPRLCFLDEVPVHFAVGNAQQHYHVPLIASPWTYSTYRGGLPPKAA